MSVAIFAAALGSGLVAGVFFAFSNFVMRALDRLPPAHGIAAMQSINVTVITPLFMTALFGTGLLGAALAVWAAASLDDDRAPWTLAGGAVYAIGTVAVTMLANVPRNNALERLEPEDPAAAGQWAGYVREWTAWNHVRTLAALVAAGLLTAALVEG
jgi:uncharacterized membrane protein